MKIHDLLEKIARAGFGDKEQVTVKEFNVNVSRRFRFDKRDLKCLRKEFTARGFLDYVPRSNTLNRQSLNKSRFDGCPFRLGEEATERRENEK